MSIDAAKYPDGVENTNRHYQRDKGTAEVDRLQEVFLVRWLLDVPQRKQQPNASKCVNDYRALGGGVPLYRLDARACQKDYEAHREYLPQMPVACKLPDQKQPDGGSEPIPSKECSEVGQRTPSSIADYAQQQPCLRRECNEGNGYLV